MLYVLNLPAARWLFLSDLASLAFSQLPCALSPVPCAFAAPCSIPSQIRNPQSEIRNVFLYSLNLFFPKQPCRSDKED
jgi:hypothetical protein